MVLVEADKAGFLDVFAQVVRIEYPDVTTLNLVVGIRQSPADPFGEKARHAHAENTARFQDAVYFFYHRTVVVNVFKDLGADDLVERVVGKGQPEPACDRDHETP